MTSRRERKRNRAKEIRRSQERRKTPLLFLFYSPSSFFPSFGGKIELSEAGQETKARRIGKRKAQPKRDLESDEEGDFGATSTKEERD